ncbi:MAG: DUF6236 family protein [Candidatus Zixiibacteriota bacterium]
MAFTKALYYPWIDIKDHGWLHSAALYWDKIQTIVPKSIKQPYKDKSSIEFYDKGILEPLKVSPEMYEVDSLTEDIIKYFDAPETLHILLSRKKGGNIRIHRDKLPIPLQNMTYIHPEKLASEVAYMIRETGLGRLNKDGWFEMDSEFAEYYMTLLASRLSENYGLGLVTPLSQSHGLNLRVKMDGDINKMLFMRRVSQYGRQTRLQKRKSTAPHVLTQGMLVDVVIDRIGIAPSTSIKKIIQFRKDHASEVGNFRNMIEKLTNDIPKDINIIALRQYINDKYNNDVEPAIKELKESLEGSKIKWLTKSWLKLSFLSFGSSSALVGLGLNFPNALLVGSGISLVGMGILYNEDKKKMIRENPYSYVLAMEKEFK